MAGTKSKSGGSRFSAHPKSRLTDPKIAADWKRELFRAITTASANSSFLRKNSFYSLREIQKAYGLRAVNEFKEWFEAARLFDQVQGDRLYQEWKRGLLDDTMYKKFLHTVAHSWSWSLKPEKQELAWKISRGLVVFSSS